MASLHPTACPLDCPDACGVLVEVDDQRRFVRLKGNPAHSWSRGTLCAKTSQYGELLDHPERLREPLVRQGSSFEPISWERAIGLVCERLSRVAARDVLALWYGGSMGLVQRKFPLRMFHALGATLHDGGVCDAASTAGFECVLGRCVGADLEAADESDLVLLWGADIARTVQHLQPAVQRLARRGVPCVAIDVYRTDTIRDLESRGGRGFVLRPGSDAQLALYLARVAFERGFADQSYLARECLGAAEFEAHVRAAHSASETARITGLAETELEALVELLRAARKPLIKTGVGWTRRRNGAMSMRAVCSLAAVLGHAERVHYESFAHFGLAEDAIIRPDLRPSSSPQKPVVQVQLGRQLEAGDFKAVFVWCHNPAATLPESARFQRGFARDDLFTVVHEHFLTETARLADLVLPATMFVEHADVYRSYGTRVVQFARAAARAPASARTNVQTFAAIAKALGLPRETWDVDDEALCRELLEASRPRISDDELARILAGEPVKLRAQRFADWGTPSGRIELASASAARAGQPLLASYVPDQSAHEHGSHWLVCAPSVATHNSTYAHSARHVKKAGAPRVWMHPDDARERGFVEGERVRLVNARAALTLPIALDAHVGRGLVRIDGLPRAVDLPEVVGINALVSGDTSDLGDGNVLYSTRVDIERAV